MTTYTHESPKLGDQFVLRSADLTVGRGDGFQVTWGQKQARPCYDLFLHHSGSELSGVWVQLRMEVWFLHLDKRSPWDGTSFVSFCLFPELRRSPRCCSCDRGWSDGNTLTLERQLCWSRGAVGIWGDGCSLCPFSAHWLIDTVFMENSLSCFTWDDRCKTKWTTASAGGAVVNNRWCCVALRLC